MAWVCCTHDCKSTQRSLLRCVICSGLYSSADKLYHSQTALWRGRVWDVSSNDCTQGVCRKLWVQKSGWRTNPKSNQTTSEVAIKKTPVVDISKHECTSLHTVCWQLVLLQPMQLADGDRWVSFLMHVMYFVAQKACEMQWHSYKVTLWSVWRLPEDTMHVQIPP